MAATTSAPPIKAQVGSKASLRMARSPLFMVGGGAIVRAFK
jgi:hypothetical protein